MDKISILFLLLFLQSLLYGQEKQVVSQETRIVHDQWRDIGPFRGGRSAAVTGVPGKPGLFYFGATGGGIWRSVDSGNSWTNISDGFFGGSIGSVTVAESDPNVIFVGGGECTVRGNVSFGDGIWKSTDAGDHWKHMGLESSRHIPRIRIHPNDPNIVLAAVLGDLYKDSEERGIYRTEDGGENWEKTLFVNDSTGFIDLVMDPNNPRIVFASSWTVRRTPYSLSSGGNGSGIWKSTDGGITWENISKNEGLPEGIWGISGICVSPKNSKRLWAIIENENGGVFRSEDGGEIWHKVNDERKLRQRAWYYSRIYADTEDEDKVYVLNVQFHRSKDGGKSFESIGTPHGDHHDLWIDPKNSSRMIIGDDGGAQVTGDEGKTWTTYYNQPTAQFYRVITDDHFPFRIYAAQQDNSTVRISSRSMSGAISERDWEPSAGGESAHIAIDPMNNDIVYGGSYGGFMTRLDHRTSNSRAINVWPDNPMGHGAEGMKYRFQWNFPVFFSKHDPQKLYACSNHLHLSTDEGRSWTIKSPDLTTNDPTKLGPSGGPITKDNTGVEYYCTIFAADESPVQEGLIWVGTDDGLVHYTADGGEHWMQVTPKDLPKNTMINSIEPDPADPASAYIAATSYKMGDYRPFLFKTKDFGKSWKKITKGIQAEHFTRVIRCDPKREGLLFAGTESGLYISFDDGESWKSFQLNLPVVPVTDLRIKEGKLIAATQGRGIWILDDLSLIRQLSEMPEKVSFHLFTPSDSYLVPGFQIKNPGQQGTNQKEGVIFNYFIRDSIKHDTVVFTIRDATGNLVRRFSNFAKEEQDKMEIAGTGAHQFQWNMRYPAAKSFEGMVLWWGSLEGPRALPGTYTAELEYQDMVKAVKFNILPDPRLNVPRDEMEAQFNFLKEVNQKVSEAHQTITDIRMIREQLLPFKTMEGLPDEIHELATEIDSAITLIEENLYQTKNRSSQDPLNFPIKLTNKLAHLNSLVSIGNAGPTEQSKQLKSELETKINSEIDNFLIIKKEKIPRLNVLIKQNNVDMIRLKEKQ